MKNVIQNFFSRTLFVAYFIGLLSTPLSLLGAAAVAPAPSFNMGNIGPDQMPSPEELAIMEQQLKEEFETAYASLSMEEKKEVDAYMEKVSKMSEEELFKHIEEEFEKLQEEMDQQKKQAEKPVEPAPAPTPVVAAPEEKVAEPVVIPPCKETDNILALIDSIIQHTNSFMLKASIIPDFSTIVHRFGSQKSTKGFKPKNMSWASLKEKLESFLHKLYTMKEKDPHTKKYRYINAFGDNTSLCNNLNKLRTTLNTYEEKVEAPKFGLGEISLTSKRAINEVLDGYIEALFLLDIPDALDKVIKTYEPRAQKLSKQEEEAQKRALEESKKASSSRPTTVVRGRESTRYSPVAQPSRGYTDGGYHGDSYNPYYGNESYNPYQGSNYEPSPSQGSSGSGRPSGGGRGGRRSGKPDEQQEEESAKRGGSMERPDASASSQKPPASSVNEVEENASRVAKTIMNSQLNTIYDHMKSPEQKSDELATIQLPDAVKRAKRAVSAAKTVKRRIQNLPEKNKLEAKQELASAVIPHRAIFDMFIEQVAHIKEDKTIQASKRAAYQSDLEELAKQLQQLKNEVGLSEPIRKKEDVAEQKEAIDEAQQQQKEAADAATTRAAERKAKRAGAPAQENVEQKEKAEKEGKEAAAPVAGAAVEIPQAGGNKDVAAQAAAAPEAENPAGEHAAQHPAGPAPAVRITPRMPGVANPAHLPPA